MKERDAATAIFVTHAVLQITVSRDYLSIELFHKYLQYGEKEPSSIEIFVNTVTSLGPFKVMGNKPIVNCVLQF